MPLSHPPALSVQDSHGCPHVASKSQASDPSAPAGPGEALPTPSLGALLAGAAALAHSKGE